MASPTGSTPRPRARWPLEEVNKPAQPGARRQAGPEHGLRSHHRARRGRLGQRAGERRRARRAPGHAVGPRPGYGRGRCADQRENPRLPGVRLDDGIAVTDDIACMAEPPMRSCWRCRRKRCVRSPGARRRSRRGRRVIACAKGIEQRHAQVHDRGDCGMRAARAARHPVGAELRRGRGARPADGGDSRRARREDRRRARARARLGDVPALSFDRRARRRDRRRGQERARHRRRHRRRDADSAPARRRRSPRAASPSCSASARRSAHARKRWSGFPGLGDLILTCSSPQSRNFSLGLALGAGVRRTRRATPARLPRASSPHRCWSRWRIAKRRRHADRERRVGGARRPRAASTTRSRRC